MNKPKSNTLFHFTKNIEYLKSILINGLYPRYCLEDHSWVGYEEHVAYPLICFCDIPLSRIREHTDFYGSYGIGLTKEWGLKNNLNPVIYSPNYGLVAHVTDYIASTISSDVPTENEKGEKAFWGLVKLVKPLSGKMIVGGEPVEKDFYQENEWRFTPEENIRDTIIFSDRFETEYNENNNEVEKYKLEFSPSDIKYIFVKDDNDIPVIIDLINNEMGSYPLNDVKILSSRVLSLRTIEIDL